VQYGKSLGPSEILFVIIFCTKIHKKQRLYSGKTILTENKKFFSTNQGYLFVFLLTMQLHNNSEQNRNVIKPSQSKNIQNVERSDEANVQYSNKKYLCQTLQPQQTTSTPELVVGRAGVVGVGVEQVLNTSPAFSSAEDTQPPPFTPHTELILNSSSCNYKRAVPERMDRTVLLHTGGLCNNCTSKTVLAHISAFPNKCTI
jgi:hypothetical protein